MFTEAQKTALSAKLHPDHVKSRTQAGRKLSYIEGWQAISEANRIFGFDGWTRETIRLEETNRELVMLKGDRGEYQQWRVGFLAVVKIVVFAGDTLITRHGTGFGSGMGKPEALGDAVESAIKEAETDAMKRAFMTFGNPFGLALYDKSQENVGIERGSDDRFAPNAAARKSSAAAKRDGDWERMQLDMMDAKSAVSMQRLWDDYRRNEYPKWNKDWQREADELFAHRIAQFSAGDDLQETLADSVEAEPQTRAEYVQQCHDIIMRATDAERLLVWWNNDKAARTRFSLNKEEVFDLKARVVEKRKELTPNAPHGRDVSGRPLEVVADAG